MTKQNRSQAPTAHDVAALLGISQSSVSRAFTAGASISDEMREKVKAAALEVGYRPNILARSLIKQQSKIVGVVAGHMENPFFANAIERLAAKLSGVNMRILLFTAETNASGDVQVDELISYQVSAVVLMAVGVSSALAMQCEQAGIPVILFSRTSQTAGTAFEVVGDNEAGAVAIAQRFVETGRQRIAFMAGYHDSSTSLTREAAFTGHLAQRGLPAPRRVVGNYTRGGAQEAARQLFADKANRPDAVFCANDLMAIATIETMRLDFGLEPGRDCAVAGFDDSPMAGWPSFQLTTYSQPVETMVGHIFAFITGENQDASRSIVVKGELVIRKTA